MSVFSKQVTAECASVDISVGTGLEKDAGKPPWPPDLSVLVHSGPELLAALIYYLQVDNDDFQFPHI